MHWPRCEHHRALCQCSGGGYREHTCTDPGESTIEHYVRAVGVYGEDTCTVEHHRALYEIMRL